MDYHELACELLDIRGSQPQIQYDQMISKLLKVDIHVLNYLKVHQYDEKEVYPKNLSDALAISTV